MPAEDGSLTLCVPDWGPPVPIELQLSGDPLTLVGSGASAIECCDVGCLPRTMVDASSPAGASPTSCSASTVGGALARVVIETPAVLTAAERDAWTALLCVLPEDEDAPIGALTRTINACAGDASAPCIREDLATGPEGTAREYSVRVESPVGSVLGSAMFSIAVDGTEATRRPELALGSRTLVRGTVRLDDEVCDPDTAAQTGCGSEGAIVLAERLRMGDESASTIPGPYFHEVETFYDPIAGRPGGYVLPLDRGGVYLVTALPASGSLGGPADIRVVDLRNVEVDEVELDMVLRAGVFVTLQLDTQEPNGFDPRSSVTPLDLGSWKSDGFTVPNTGEPIDLNRIGQCLTTPDEGPIACKIRRLIPSTSLTPSQVGQVQFTARAASPDAPAVCPGA